VHRQKIWERSAEDDYHALVECAVCADGTSPASEFLTALRAGTWEEDPRFAPPSDPEQIHDLFKLLSKIKWVARYGEPEEQSAVKDLEEGVWEFRHGTRRLSYWDTPGDGSYTPKHRVSSVAEWNGEGYGTFYWYPRMDPILRLGNGWVKTGQYAPPEEIDRSLRVREEDVSHDQ
jgi:hypothetical protein